MAQTQPRHLKALAPQRDSASGWLKLNRDVVTINVYSRNRLGKICNWIDVFRAAGVNTFDMANYSRQALAAYAFFEDAKERYDYTEDALIPLVLPAIAQRSGEIFSPSVLAEALEPLFGPELVLQFSESILDALIRHGYAQQSVVTEDGVVCVYTEKTNGIEVDTFILRAERDIAVIIESLRMYVAFSKPLFEVPSDDRVLASQFMDWITTIESPFGEYAAPSRNLQTRMSCVETASTNAEPLSIMFSGFMSWASRERSAVFDILTKFAELGLVIDLVSEIRLPTRKVKKVELTVALDSGILLDLAGANGPLAQRTGLRLTELCKEHKIPLVTFTHLIDEIREIAYNALQPSTTDYRGSVNDAMRRYPDVVRIVANLHKNPDALIKRLGVQIIAYGQIHDARAVSAFDVNDIQQFANKLPYDKSKTRMAQRDAQSLAYVARRQNRHFSSNLYDSKCAIVTMSRPFATCARSYLREEKDYPHFAICPVVELRHFATILMLAFGSSASKEIVRAELVASCGRIARASPELVTRISGVLRRMGTLTDEQIDAALADPGILSEFAIVTGNDARLVTQHNGHALLDVVTNAAIKDAEIRHDTLTREMEDAYLGKLEVKSMEIMEAQERADSALTGGAISAEQISSAVDYIVEGIKTEMKVIWTTVTGLVSLAGLLIFLDSRRYLEGWVWLSLTAVLGFIAVYLVAAVFKPEIAPHRLRAWVFRWTADRRIKRIDDDNLRQSIEIKVLALCRELAEGRGLDEDRARH